MKPVTDEALALLGVANAMQKITVQLEHLGLAANKASHNLLDVGDVGAKLTHRGFLLETIFGHTGQPSAMMELLGATRGGGYGSDGGGSGGGGGRGWGGPGGEGGGGGGGGGVGGGGSGSGRGWSPKPRSLREITGKWGIQEGGSEWYGKQSPYDAHKSPETAANFWTQKLLRHGKIDFDLIPMVQAHLTGGQAMSMDDRRRLYKQMRGPSAAFKADREALIEAERLAKAKRLQLKKPEDIAKVQLEDHEIANIDRFDRDRILPAHRKQMAGLFNLSDQRRIDSIEHMDGLSEDAARLHALGGAGRIEAEKQLQERLENTRKRKEADELAVQKSSADIARMGADLEAFRKVVNSGPAVTEAERDAARQRFEESLDAQDDARRVMEYDEQKYQAELQQPVYMHRLPLRETLRKQAAASREELDLATRARDSHEEEAHRVDAKLYAQNQLPSLADTYAAQVLKHPDLEKTAASSARDLDEVKGLQSNHQKAIAELLAKRQSNKGDDEQRKGLREQARAGKVTSSFADKLDEARKGLRGFVDRLTIASERVMKKGILSISSMTEAASPDAFSTLSGSWKLLLASMGEAFLPMIVKLSATLQRGAKAVQGWSSGIKSFLATTAVGITGLAAAGMLYRTLGGPALRAYAYGRAPGAGGTGGTKGKIQTPFFTPLTMGIAVTGGLFVAGLGQRFSKQADNMDNAIALVRQFEESFDPEAERRTTYYQQLRDRTPQQRQTSIEYWERHYREQLDASQRTMGETGVSMSRHRKAAGEYAEALQELHRLRQYRGELIGVNVRGPGGQVPDIGGGPPAPGALRLQTKQMTPGRGVDEKNEAAFRMLLDFQNRVQPGFFSVEDIGKKVQLEALAESPLQQEIRQIQLRQLEALLLLTEQGKKTHQELTREGFFNTYRR